MKGFINGVFSCINYNALYYKFWFQKQKGLKGQTKTAPNRSHCDLDNGASEQLTGQR